MSTPLLNATLVVEVVKTLTHIHETKKHSDAQHERDFAKAIEKLFDKLELFNADLNTTEGRYNNEKALISYVLDNNVESHIERYEERADQAGIAKQREIQQQIVKNIHRLDNTIPHINPLTISGLHAMYSDLIYGLDIANHQNDVLNDFSEDLMTFSIKSQPEYTQASENIHDIAMSALSIYQHGSALLCHTSPLKEALERLKCYGKTTSDHPKIIYGDNAFTALLVDVKGLGDTYSEKGYLTGEFNSNFVSDKRPIELVSLIVGEKPQISSDIPKPTLEDAYSVVKVMHQISEKYPDSSRIKNMLYDYSVILSTSATGYRHHFDRTYKSNDLTL